MTKVATALVTSLALLGVSTAASAESARPVQAAAASKLSLSAPVRAGAKASKKNGLVGTSLILAVLAAAAVVAGIVVIADDNSGSN